MIYLKYFASVFVWQFLNPFGIWQSILQNGGQAIAILRSRMSKIGAPGISMSLPFSGYWTVVNGGVEESTSHSWNLITQRYAYDFIFPGKDEKKYAGNGRNADEYYGFGQDVLAPADGTVIKVQNNIKDYAFAGTGSVDILTSDFRGNHVIIRHANHVYSFIAHLKKNSCTARPGDFVTRGQVLGQCGNSGHSTEPHIHFHVQDHPNFYLAVGLPIAFENIEVKFEGSQAANKVQRGYISKNCRVQNYNPHGESPDRGQQGFNEIQPAKGQLFPFFTSILNVLGLLVWLFLAYIWLIQPLLKSGKL